ncbi:MAG: hypothetical protein AAFV07_20180, partial [Bacteroidota bacterium]
MKSTSYLPLFIIGCLLTSPALGADLIRVSPVTDQILMLHFDEGHLDYEGIGQDRYNGITAYFAFLDLSRAVQPG